MSSQTIAVETTVTNDGPTVVGVDLGVKRLLVAAPADAGPDIVDTLTVGGGVERALYNALGDTLNRLDGQHADTIDAEHQTVERYRSLLRQRFVLAAASLVEYADRVGADTIALEKLDERAGTLAECARGQTKAGAWVLPAFRDHLESTLAAEGYSVEHVDARYTTQRCHCCGELADVSRATITCETDDCPVETVCRDQSAAVTIAKRAAVTG